MDISNTTRISKSQFGRYYRFVMAHNLPFVLALLFFSILYYVFIFGTLNNDLFFHVFICVTEVILICTFVIIIPPFKTYKKIKSNVYQYVFTNEHFEYITRASETTGQSQYKYESLLKAYERKDAFYLYAEGIKACVVNKNGFTQGSMEELRSLLKSKLGTKFKCY